MLSISKSGSADLYEGDLIDPLTRLLPWPGTFVDIELPAKKSRRAVRINLRSCPGPETEGDAPQLGRMFCVHGLGGSSTNFTELQTVLAGHLPSCSIDLLGYGVSDPSPTGDYSISAQAACVIAAIEASGPTPVHLVGNSMGGLISLVVAATRPDLVRTLTLISPAMPTYRFESGLDPRLLLLGVPGLRGLLERRLALGDPHDAALMQVQLCFADTSLAPDYRLEQTAREVQLRQQYPWSMAAFGGSVRAIGKAVLQPGQSNPWRLAATLRVPTLVVWGNQDQLVPFRHGARLAEVVPEAKLLLLEGVGHTPQLEAPEVTARAVLGLLSQHAA